MYHGSTITYSTGINAKSLKECAVVSEIEVNKNTYTILDKKKKTACFNYTKEKSKTITIPSHIEYKGKTYTIAAIGRYVGKDEGDQEQEAYESVISYSKVQKIIVPSIVKKLYPRAFAGDELKKVNCKGKKYIFSKGLLMSSSKKTIYYATMKKGTYKIPNSVGGIKPEVFWGHKITTLKLGKKTKYIGEKAFYENRKLKKVVWNKKIKVIGKKALVSEMGNICDK